MQTSANVGKEIRMKGNELRGEKYEVDGWGTCIKDLWWVYKNQSTETDSLSHVTTNRGGAALTKVFDFSLTGIPNK